MTQTLRSAFALFSRLSAVYTNQLELAHTAPVHATANNFLTGIDEVFCIMVHETDGSIARNRARRWYDDYRNGHGTGHGPQLVVWADGTVMSLVELPYRTTHGNNENSRAIGIETGHGNDGRFGDLDVAPDASAAADGSASHAVRNGWHGLSTDTEDVAGSASAKFFVMHAGYAAPSPLPAGYPTLQPEVVTAPWSTNDYLTPAREPPGTQHPGMYTTLVKNGGHAPPQPTIMLFTEWHYRSWALLTRYLCEALLVPRNFPVMPHSRRDHSILDETVFKNIVLADERFDMIVSGLHSDPLHPYHGVNLAFTAADFTGGTPADATNLRDHYSAAVVKQGSFNVAPGLQNVRMNLAWLRFFDYYRGIHGHGFSGNQVAGQNDHDCPGPMFDWHRFAREVWDWWWWPFDFDAAHARTDVPDRPYRRANSSTPLIEYFFYDPPGPYAARAAAPGGIQGASSSPATFRLEQHAPIYALANGELVAARYPLAGNTSMAFVLVRHEIFYWTDVGGVMRAKGLPDPNDAWHGGLADTGRLDYNADPGTVYTLYMHLGRPDRMNFGQVDDHNPDWLNRVLIRMTECDLALPSGKLNPQINPSRADLTQPPSASGERPTPLEAWQMDQADYRHFLTRLAAGQVAVAPFRSPLDSTGPTPVRVILGDYLGVAGVIRQQAGVPTFGVRVEVFSPQLPSTFFTLVPGQNGWNVPAGVTHPVLYYQSEWIRLPSTAEATALHALGVDAAAVAWWSDVQMRQHWDLCTPPSAKLPPNGRVYHYQPLDFMQWLNDLTWSSEWPKYRITSGTPAAPAARPTTPRPRRF